MLMAVSKEAQFSAELIKCLNAQYRCHFRKTCDRVQIGLPDIIGCAGGVHVEIEIKHENALLTSKRVPTGSHPFTGAQIKELLKAQEAGGISIGVVSCGKRAWAFPASWIGEDGRICLDDHRGDHRLATFTLPDIRSFVCLMRALQQKEQTLPEASATLTQSM
jgi:hypothetical protein